MPEITKEQLEQIANATTRDELCEVLKDISREELAQAGIV